MQQGARDPEGLLPLPLYGLKEHLVAQELADNTSQRHSFAEFFVSSFNTRARTRADGVPLRLGTELLGRAPWRFGAALCLHVGPQFSPGHPAWQRAGGLLCYWLRRRWRQAFSKCSRQPGETSCLGCLSPPGTKRAFSAAVFFLGVLEPFIKRSTPAQDNR